MNQTDNTQSICLPKSARSKKTLAIRSGSLDGGEPSPICRTVRTPAQPLRRSRDNGRHVGGSSRSSRAGMRRASNHCLCDHRDVASNLDLHIWGVAVEACSHLGDVIGCVSHSKLHRDQGFMSEFLLLAMAILGSASARGGSQSAKIGR
jgi:hypothetical protein